MSPDEALARAAAAGLHPIRVPTPFAVGRVNAWLIEDDPLTLVDSGPNSGTSLDALEAGLRDRGHRVEDLELLVVTHQHIDHLGLVGILARRSGAEVAALDRLAPYAAAYSAEAEADDDYADALMARHGITGDVRHALRAVSRAFRAWGAGFSTTRPLADGDVLRLRDRGLRVLHRPGHSPSDTVFWDEERRILLAADHLLAGISSNPLIHRPLPRPDGTRDPAEDAARPRALPTYLASLRTTAAMPAEVVLTGHGEPVTDPAGLVAQRLRMHERRAEKLHRLLAGGPRTAHELAVAMWGDVAVTQAYLTLCEVLGHLELLRDAGRVEELVGDGPSVRFAASGGGDGDGTPP